MSLNRLKRPRITHYPGGRVCAALTAAQMTALRAAAKAANVPLPEAVRMCIERAARLVKEAHQRQRRSDRHSSLHSDPHSPPHSDRKPDRNAA